jgi:hypothetical protein
MDIQGDVLARYLGPIGGAIVGWFLHSYSQRGGKLITYYGHIDAFFLPIDNGQVLKVHTHNLVIRNTGPKVARNVRVSHSQLPPGFSVFPAREFTRHDLPNNMGTEIVFAAVVPGEQLALNYIYFPPVTADQITTTVKSDDGLAKRVNIFPTRAKANLDMVLSTIGVMTLAYFALTFCVRVSARLFP